MTKILFDCERLKYPNTGLHTFCTDLGQALIDNSYPNQEITAYIPSSEKNIFGKDAHYKIQKAWHKIFVPGASKFDVWHSSNQVSRYLPTSSRTKMILTIHDLNFMIEKKDRPSKIKKHLRQIQSRIDRASIIVCISNFVAKQVQTAFETQGKPLLVIYNGCTVKDYPSFDTPKYNPIKPFLFTIGTVLPKKNFHVLPALLQDNNYELIIAGNLSSQEYLNKIIEEAKKHDVSDRVKILGSISNQERSWYYKNCEAFLFPSIAEGFGLPVIEAMYYGKAIFLSNHTSLPEIGADAAYYFDDFEAESMQEVLKKGLIDFSSGNMTQKAKERAAHFSWDETAKSYLKLYKTLSDMH
ncbi:MAG: glycosyltransferase family 1 protein [Pedobacter sp.]|uniref:glycosyltransferase family 4 protein n=1 Tax=Pedobacter sp. TaxID=1411316 RepID=UPI0035667073